MKKVLALIVLTIILIAPMALNHINQKYFQRVVMTTHYGGSSIFIWPKVYYLVGAKQYKVPWIF